MILCSNFACPILNTITFKIDRYYYLCKQIVVHKTFDFVHWSDAEMVRDDKAGICVGSLKPESRKSKNF